jgi:hypothetical protein
MMNSRLTELRAAPGGFRSGRSPFRVQNQQCFGRAQDFRLSGHRISDCRTSSIYEYTP